MVLAAAKAVREGLLPQDVLTRTLEPHSYTDAEPAGIPTLERLYAHSSLRNQVVRAGFQPDFSKKRQAILEPALGKALARCGSPRGPEILIAYLADNRALLSEQEHTQLVALSGQDYGKDVQAWRAWLQETRGNWTPCPLLEKRERILKGAYP